MASATSLAGAGVLRPGNKYGAGRGWGCWGISLCVEELGDSNTWSAKEEEVTVICTELGGLGSSSSQYILCFL